MEKLKNYVLTKKIAKHGKQPVILVPKILEDDLKPGTIVKLTIEVMREAEE